MINLEEAVIRKLKATQHILCTVESSTGGLLAHLLTNVPGASEVYWGTVVSYDNSLKQDLGVLKTSLDQHGAVSPVVAQELAERGLEKMQAATSKNPSYALLKPRGLICISTTGIAGPGGGTEEKPVGLCYLGLAISGKKTHVEEFHAFPVTDRVQVKTQFAQKALEMIRTQF